MKLRCETCRYWARWEYDASKGDCRAGRPLHMDDIGRAVWAYTARHDWCGEHEERMELPMVEDGR